MGNTITIYLNGSQFKNCPVVIKKSSTIEEIKYLIYNTTNPQLIILKYNNRVLLDYKTLSFYKIKNNSTILVDILQTNQRFAYRDEPPPYTQI